MPNLLGIDPRRPERMQEVMIAGRAVIMAPVIRLREVKVGF
ncbi:MAG: hypothetical protein AAGB97_09310 [Dehalococcoidia bacterium]